ncbi:magnesium transporter [Brevibacterium sp. JNUCC-42]|nr:magnesium transporter [Brevibacterium sp. JNUCC-42]
MIRLNQVQFKEEYTYYMLQALKAGKREVFRKDFLDLHPIDQTEIFVELDDSRRLRVYTFLSPAELGEIFSELDPKMQRQCILELDRHYAIHMLNELPPDDAADFFGLLTPQEADFFLDRMEKEEADDIKQLLTYLEGTAGSLMTTDVVRVDLSDSVSDILERLRHSEAGAETIHYLYITDHQKRLLGVVSLRDLIVSIPDLCMGELMNTRRYCKL